MFYMMNEYIKRQYNENNELYGDSIVKVPVYNFETQNKEMLPIDLNGNVYINGTVRTGKSFLTNKLVDCIERLCPDALVVYLDVKDDYISRLYETGDKVVSYGDGLESENGIKLPYNYFKFNLIKELRQSEDPDAELKEIAEMLISGQKDRANDPFFCIAAAAIFRGFISSIIHCYKNSPSNAVVINNLKRASLSQLAEEIKKWPGNRNIIRDYLGGGSDGNPTMTKMVQSILACLAEMLDLFGGNFCTEGNDTISDFVNGKYGRHLFLEYDYGRKASSNAFFRYVLHRLIQSKLSQNTNRKQKIIMILDEAAVLNGEFGLMDGLTIGAGNGLQIILVSQSVEKLYCIAPQFNNQHITNASLSGFASIITFHPGDPESIQKLQALFGQEYRQRVVLGLSRYETPHSMVQLENIISTEELQNLGLGECFVKVKNLKPKHVKIIGC